MDDRTHWDACYLERGHGDCAQARIAKLEYTLAVTRDALAVVERDNSRLRERRDDLRAAIETAVHTLEEACVGQHPYHAERAHYLLRAALQEPPK